MTVIKCFWFLLVIFFMAFNVIAFDTSLCQEQRDDTLICNMDDQEKNDEGVVELPKDFKGTLEGEGKFKIEGTNIIQELGPGGSAEISAGKIISMTNGKTLEKETGGTAEGSVQMEKKDGQEVITADKIKKDKIEVTKPEEYKDNANGDVEIKKGEQYKDGVLVVNKFDNLKRNGATGETGVEKSESVTTPDAHVEQPLNFNGKPDEFSIDQGTVSVFGHTIRAAQPSTFSIYKNGVEVTTEKGKELEITDNAGNEVTYKAEEGNRLAISKDAPPAYKVENGILTISGKGKNEIVQTKSPSVVFTGIEGMEKIQLTGGTFRTEFPERKKDYGINIPPEEGTYTLCLRKIAGQPMGQCDGLVDYPANNIQLLGKATYMRYSFSKEQGINYLMLPVYKGQKALNKFTLQLDDKSIYGDASFENPKPEAEAAIFYSGSNEIIEGNSRLQKIHPNKEYPTVLKSIESSTSSAKITINEDILTQEDSIKVITPDSNYIIKAGNFMRNYWNRLAKTLAEFLS